MTVWICKTCGAHHEAGEAPPEHCAICEDERQYVGANGQEWLRRDAIEVTHRNEWRDLEPSLSGIGLTPQIGIGQRALFLKTPHGNVLWDCVPMLDVDSANRIKAMGGVKAICFSHPHFYTGMAEWSASLGDAPILLPEADLQHATRPGPNVRPWSGDRLEVLPGVTVHRLGGHFEGSSVLEWKEGAEGNGALFVGDTVQVAPDPRWVSFMRSYPNMIPLPAREVRRIADRVAELTFDRIYGGWWDRVILRDAKDAVARSAERYIAAISG
jgi:glyoxylase-like metal-dependent hydrolase (beta-lactamase superfamily II)